LEGNQPVENLPYAVAAGQSDVAIEGMETV
jgi:hypothetical protein